MHSTTLRHAITLLAALLLAACAGPATTPEAAAPAPALPEWAAKLESGISSELQVELNADKNPNANTLMRLTLLITAKGSIRNQSGQSLRTGPEKGVIVLSTRPDSKPGRHPFPWPRDLLKGRALSGTATIEDYSNFALMKGSRVIAFRDNTVLAVCSNPLTATVAGQPRRCVIITHGFRQSTDASTANVQKTTFTGAQTTVWPLDRTFLDGLKRKHPAGSPLHEAAVAALMACH